MPELPMPETGPNKRNFYAELAETMPTPERQEIPGYDIPQAAVLDFDRTLSNVDACMDRLYAACDGLPVNVEAIKAARANVEGNSQTFDPMALLREALSDEQFATFKENFANADEYPLLYTDAEPFMERLYEADMPFVILTTADDPQWQEMKLQAAFKNSKFAPSIKVINQKEKGPFLEELRSEGGTFEFARGGDEPAIYHAETLTLVDDRAKSFTGFTEGTSGFHLTRPGEGQTSNHRGEIPEGVGTIGSLDELGVIDGKLTKRDVSDAPEAETSPHKAEHPTAYSPTGADGLPRGDYKSYELAG